MALDREAVVRIARLARIRIPDEELDGLAGELSGILGWIETLGRLDVEGVPPMTGVGDAVLTARSDKIADGGDPAPILANAPESADGHFVVPKVIE